MMMKKKKMHQMMKKQSPNIFNRRSLTKFGGYANDMALLRPCSTAFDHNQVYFKNEDAKALQQDGEYKICSTSLHITTTLKKSM